MRSSHALCRDGRCLEASKNILGVTLCPGLSFAPVCALHREHRPNSAKQSTLLGSKPQWQEQRAHNSRGGSTGTTTDSSRTDSCSTDGGQGLGAAGAGVGAPWSAADVPAGGRVDETTARDIAGEARTMQLDGAIPASQPSFLGLPQTEPVRRAMFVKMIREICYSTADSSLSRRDSMCIGGRGARSSACLSHVIDDEEDFRGGDVTGTGSRTSTPVRNHLHSHTQLIP